MFGSNRDLFTSAVNPAQVETPKFPLRFALVLDSLYLPFSASNSKLSHVFFLDMCGCRFPHFGKCQNGKLYG